MAKTIANVISEWVDRGYVPAEPSADDTKKYTSFINQGKAAILDYCNLPQNIVNFPDGLFYPWVEISYSIMNGGVFQQANGVIKSISEGDTTIQYGSTVNQATMPIVDYSDTLNRYRRLP
jgi:hypothetical protein